MTPDVFPNHPFKGRRLDPRQKVRVYRDLHMKGVWYSIMQGGLVVAKARHIALHECVFIVNKAGALRAAIQKRKNVHAFVEGRCNVEALETQFTGPAWYNRALARFEATDFYGRNGHLHGAAHVWLGNYGMYVNGPLFA